MGTVHIYMCARLLQQGRFVPFSVSFVHLQASLENQSCICCSADIAGGLTSPNKQPPGKHSTAQCFAEYSLYQGSHWVAAAKQMPSTHLLQIPLSQAYTGLEKDLNTFYVPRRHRDCCRSSTESQGRNSTSCLVVLLCVVLLPWQKRGALTRCRLHFDPELFAAKGHPTRCYSRVTL